MDSSIIVGYAQEPVRLLLKYSNRHGVIAGATGTGKTVTLQGLAEGFSDFGVPVFMADVKGDLAGLSQAGGGNPKIEERAKQLGLQGFTHRGMPVVLWDLFGKSGHPIRTSVSEMGPLLLARLLDLNEAQEGVLNLTFKLADEEGLLLLDLKDLRAMLAHVAENASQIQIEYGNVSAATVGAIQRALLVLEQQGAEQFFGEPALDLRDLMITTPDGHGYINILAADQLMQSPRLYSTFLLWLLSELFEDLPEVGDLDQPKLVFFFDEAHLLFTDAPAALVQKIEQVVRLIRSKGVGVYFVTQNPLDIPDSVLAQLGNRVQHALRAYTPREQKAVKAAAESFRPNPAFETETAITELGVGEALVSTLGEKAAPNVVQRTIISPPASRIGAISTEDRQAVLQKSPIGGKYDRLVDRESAYERLRSRAEVASGPPPVVAAPNEPKQPKASYTRERPPKPPGGRSDSVVNAVVKSTLRSAGSQLGRSLVRGVLGSLFKGR